MSRPVPVPSTPPAPGLEASALGAAWSGVSATERAVEITIRGVVQGVGFRPFVHRLAIRHDLSGWVRNEPGSVRVRAQGDPAAIEGFARALRSDAPPLARIDTLTSVTVDLVPRDGFRIVPSDLAPHGRLPVSPDVSICDACAAELADPADRRHRYPFITCTDCGPRFTVIESMPYDRERSTMRHFRQCAECLAEYGDPTDRRYHSETNSCPTCGPRVWLEGCGANGPLDGDDAVVHAGHVLSQGRILAVRGLGGFHLAVDATDPEAVVRLRERKHRDAKPLAVMVGSLGEARALADLSPAEEALLTSRARPIVLVRPRASAGLAPAVAPGLDRVGLVIAYTPLHLLLLEAAARPLVMTSGNLSEEPIATGNDEARRRLASIADGFLLHDREIVARYDDSLVRVVDERPVVLRRARGYAPLPLSLPVPAPEGILAVGPHLKNTFTLADGDQAYVSQHIGDLENLETLHHFDDARLRYEGLFRIEPRWVVRDLHPGYMSTRVAETTGLEELPPVQHHHAHVAAVLGEHGVEGPALGLAFDGTGYGIDGRVWGFELIEADLTGFRRLAHLRYAPLPGGDRAARLPWRSLLGYASLDPSSAAWLPAALADVAPREIAVAGRQIERGLNAPLASSLGRLFDAAAALVGLRVESSYEGQAAMELESAAGALEGGALPFPVRTDLGPLPVLDPLPLLSALAAERRLGAPPDLLAARFHDSVVDAVSLLAVSLCRRRTLTRIALSGGCFQNARLASGVRGRLEEAGLDVLTPVELGPNDGAVSYGQAVVAAARLGA